MKANGCRSIAQSSSFVALLTLFVAAASGVALTRSPRLILVIAGGAGVVALASLGRRIERIFLISVVGILVGYAFQDRGFAYFGYPPLYVGELVLILGLACLAFARIRWRLSYLHILLLTFMLLGLIRTLPYYGTYRIDAFRDAALWYYSLYAMIVSLLLTRSRVQIGLRIYARMLPYLTGWLLVMSVFFRFLPASLPHFPGSPLPIFSVMKPGDRGVILAGLAAFVLVGLYERLGTPRRVTLIVFWLCWLLAALLVAVKTRGGMLAMGSALLVIAVVQPSRKWMQLAAVGGLVVALLVVVNPTIDTGGRQISVNQLTTNIQSIYSNETSNSGGLQGTKDWRLEWWTKIIDYTFHGPYFWTGKGFGINLASADGFQVNTGDSLRSPHNSHMTVLARMGVPGLALWVLFQLSFAWSMLSAHLRARTRGHADWARLDLWILATWLAVMVNTAFDVYLEGPQGAIPFWCMVGLGLAALRIQQELPEDSVATALTTMPASIADAPTSRP